MKESTQVRAKYVGPSVNLGVGEAGAMGLER